MSNQRQQRAARAEQMRKEREKADRKQRNLITVAIVVVVVALIAVGGYAVKSQNDNAAEVLSPGNTTKDFGVVYTTADAGGTVPTGTKPVSVELYEDFQCPGCLAFEQASNAFLKEQVKSGAATITYRIFSFLDDNGGSPNGYSHRSANAALCALDQGGVQDYVKVHDYLYQHQPQERTNGPENDALIKSLEGLGISGIESCVTSERFVPWIDQARAAGDARGVDSTPTVYVGGKQVESLTPDGLQAAIGDAKTS